MFVSFHFSAASHNHKDADCFMMFVLSHGEEGTLYAKDAPYKPDRLWTPFTADQCPSLAGKPKMFFIQVNVYCVIDSSTVV